MPATSLCSPRRRCGNQRFATSTPASAKTTNRPTTSRPSSHVVRFSRSQRFTGRPYRSSGPVPGTFTAVTDTLSPALRAVSDAVLAVAAELDVEQGLQRRGGGAPGPRAPRLAAVGGPGGGGGV